MKDDAKKEQKPLIGQATEEQLAAWKKECGDGIYSIVVPVYNHIAYFRNPTRHDVATALAMASDENPLAALEEFGRLCYIGGSEEVLKNDKMFLSARYHLKDKLQNSEVPALLVNL